MRAPPLPADEEQRLAALDELGVVETPAEERFDRITDLARRVFGVPISLVSLVTRDRQWFKSRQGLAVSDTSREISFCGHAILQSDPLVVQDASTHADFADNPLVTGPPEIRFYAGCPLLHAGHAVGTLCLIDHKPRRFAAEDIATLRDLAALVETELRVRALSAEQDRLVRALDESRRHAHVDHLTGTWNRRGVDTLLPAELSRAARAGDAAALMLIDVDHFKSVNDRFGHPVGDLVLQEVARRIRQSLRPHDLLGRYGGDEFIAFLGHCDRSTAADIARRMLAAVNGAGIELPQAAVACTLSIGLYTVGAGYPAMTAEALLQAADAALYQAKSRGRNQFAIG